MYDEIVAALKAIPGLPVKEYEWETRPAGNHATVGIDFGADGDQGDDHHQDQAFEGSVDLFTKGMASTVAAQVEAVLESICGAAWELNTQEYDRETKKIHREYTFQIEVL